MIERGGRAGFLHEAPVPVGVGHLPGRQDLDCHEPIEVGVAGLVDDTHSAFAQRLENLDVEQPPADHGHPSWFGTVVRAAG
jgi:hypothetical protein